MKSQKKLSLGIYIIPSVGDLAGSYESFGKHKWVGIYRQDHLAFDYLSKIFWMKIPYFTKRRDMKCLDVYELHVCIMSALWRHAIACDDDSVSIGLLVTNFWEILVTIPGISLKMHLKMSSAKWRPFYSGLCEFLSFASSDASLPSSQITPNDNWEWNHEYHRSLKYATLIHILAIKIPWMKLKWNYGGKKIN